MTYTKKKEMLAMLLAGGQGSRLGVLTNYVAKPAVPFGGKYRIIDFTLSNCVNSGIDTIGVLTQYQPLELNSYIGNGAPWDLDRLFGGVSILPPYVRGKAGEWYKGTANAIYQNMQFIEMYHPEYVLILSGDHIYKMNYALMLEHHKKMQADCTISVIRVPLEEASRFGVMNTDENLNIYEFEEKPEHPKSNLASMGVYIFNWSKLSQYLMADERNEKSSNDFGKDVIPAMLAGGEKLCAYEYKGYWKDVGTVESLWEANMDLLDVNVPIHLDDPPWKIYSRNGLLPPQYIGNHAKLDTVSLSEGCEIDGTLSNSIVFPNVKVEEGAVIHKSILMPGVTVKKGASVEYAIIANDTVIGENAKIGRYQEPETDDVHRPITVLRQSITIGDGIAIPAGTIVEDDVVVDSPSCATKEEVESL